MSLYVAAYDIQDNRRRAKVATVLSEYGERLQRSVFLVSIESEDLLTLKQRVGALLSHWDQFDLIPIDQHPQRTWVAWQTPPAENSSVLLL